MIDSIKTTFPLCNSNNCLHSKTDSFIFIKDPVNGCCLIVNNGDLYHFSIKNPKNKTVNVLMIDKCLFNQKSSHKKCDFVAFDNKIFCFIEIKDTTSRSSKHKKNAVDQLRQTLIKFAAIDFTKYNIEAIVAWNYQPSRPLVSTLMQSAKIEFLTTFRAKLYEGNEKEFN